MNIDRKKIQQAARGSVPLAIKTYILPPATEAQLNEILEIFLKELGRRELHDSLFYCLNELAVNAKKANTKRVYFEELGLDITNEDDYKKGMSTFKQATLENIQHYLQLQKARGLYIKIIFHIKNNVLSLYVVNNTEMTREEKSRVYDRIIHARAFTDMEEAFESVLDDSEGAGLGLVIMILMLKRIGLDEHTFDVDTERGETIARITIPVKAAQLQKIQEVSEKIIEHINTIPHFPQSIVVLQKALNDPNTKISDVSRKISTDPSLTADLLKLVNSVDYMLPKRMTNINEAVNLVGLKAIKNLLYSYGAQITIDSGTPETQMLWEHSHRTAHYAYMLARELLKRNDILDDVYIGGILHDIGKIVFGTVHPDLLKKIQEFTRQKGIETSQFENFAIGLSHAEIGATIAEKWNFPDMLVNAIRFHHNPLDAPKECYPVTISVYLANILANVDEGRVDYGSIDPVVLTMFNVTSSDALKKIHTRLTNTFTKEQRN